MKYNEDDEETSWKASEEECNVYVFNNTFTVIELLLLLDHRIICRGGRGRFLGEQRVVHFHFTGLGNLKAV